MKIHTKSHWQSSDQALYVHHLISKHFLHLLQVRSILCGVKERLKIVHLELMVVPIVTIKE